MDLCRFAIALFLTTFLSFLSYSNSSPTSALSRDIDDYVSALTECKGVTGMAVTVVRGDRVLHKKGYGYADLKSGAKVGTSTRFCVASLTKSFTATLLSMLLSETGHDWDTPIAVLMPGLVFRDPFRTQELSLRDLLSHKVGYPSYDFLWLSQALSLDEILRRLRYLEPVRPFRSDFNYSNLMYILAGRVAEHLGRRSWELLVRERILEPLGMNQTGFAWEVAVESKRYAKPHKYDPETDEYGPLPEESIREISLSLSAASICTTATDMAKWMRFLLNRDSSDAIKNTPLLDDTFKAQTSLPDYWNMYTFRPEFSPGKYVDYGLGWFTGNYRGYKYHDHYGYISQYFSLISLLPDQNISVFVTTNGVEDAQINMPVLLLTTFITDRLLNETPYQDAKKVCEFNPQERSPEMPMAGGGWQFTSLIPFDPYIGRYGHPVFGNVSVFVDPESEDLYLKYGAFKFKLELDDEAEEEGRFRIKPTKWWTWICTQPEDFVQFSPYNEGETSWRVAIPCFEPGLADMFFNRDLKLSDVENPVQDNRSLKMACSIRSGQAQGQVVNVVLLVLAYLMLHVT